jgi:hypothetical protein
LSDTGAIILPLHRGSGSQSWPGFGDGLNPNSTGTGSGSGARTGAVAFNRGELSQILNVYGRMVASGEWRDYAIDMLRDKAVFSIFRRTCETPIYRIEKTPKLARKQGAYCVVAASGHILKRGHDLKRVLMALDKGLRLVEQ